jgi:PAS domain S-box-containing protein
MYRHPLATRIQTLRAKLTQLEQQLPQLDELPCLTLETAIDTLMTTVSDHLPAVVLVPLPLPTEPSAAQWQALSACLPVGIFTADVQGDCTYVSQRCQEIVGYTIEETLGQGWTQFVHPDDRDRVLIQWLPCAQAGLCNADEFRVHRPSGEIRWLFARSAPIYAEQGQLLGHIGTIEDITKQKQAEAQIKASLEEKDALLQEIHHRVKNNLQIVSSLFYLQAARMDDPLTRQIFEDSQSRISSMALVHDTLYRSQDFARIDFSTYVQNLTAHLFHTYRLRSELVKLEVQVDRGVMVSLDQAIPCGLILNELMTNALKHGFPQEQQGSVRVTLSQLAEQICLTVQNDGNGLPDYFELQTSEFMGLKLVQALVEQIQGQLEIETEINTQFKIKFRCS